MTPGTNRITLFTGIRSVRVTLGWQILAAQAVNSLRAGSSACPEPVSSYSTVMGGPASTLLVTRPAPANSVRRSESTESLIPPTARLSSENPAGPFSRVPRITPFTVCRGSRRHAQAIRHMHGVHVAFHSGSPLHHPSRSATVFRGTLFLLVTSFTEIASVELPRKGTADVSRLIHPVHCTTTRRSWT